MIHRFYIFRWKQRVFLASIAWWEETEMCKMQVLRKQMSNFKWSWDGTVGHAPHALHLVPIKKMPTRRRGTHPCFIIPASSQVVSWFEVLLQSYRCWREAKRRMYYFSHKILTDHWPLPSIWRNSSLIKCPRSKFYPSAQLISFINTYSYLTTS